MSDSKTDAEMLKESLTDAAEIANDLNSHHGPTRHFEFDATDVRELGIRLYMDRQHDFDVDEFTEQLPWFDNDDDNDFQVK